MDNFNFFLAKTQRGIGSNFDGILGMSRPYTTSTFTNGPLLMHKLKEAGAIANNIFAFYLTNNPEQSSVQIGGYDPAKIMSGASILWMSIPDHFFWIITITGFRVGPSNTFADGSPSAFDFGGRGVDRGIVDTGTSLFYVPSGIISAFVKTVFNGRTFDSSYNPFFISSCDRSLYPSIFLYNSENEVYLEVTPENYVLSVDIGISG